MGNKIQNIYIGTQKVRPRGWKPGTDTIAYWTFDDQSTTQMTDVTGNGNNLSFSSGTPPTYTLLDGTDYYATFSGGRFTTSSLTYSGNKFSEVFWVKITATSKMYLSAIGQYSPNVAVIYGFNSGEIEVYSYISPTTYRTTIKSNTPQNTWMCIGVVRDTNSVDTYYNGQLVNSGVTWGQCNVSGAYFGGTTNEALKGSQNNIILESRLWTAQDMADYYNQTKAKYGL